MPEMKPIEHSRARFGAASWPRIEDSLEFAHFWGYRPPKAAMQKALAVEIRPQLSMRHALVSRSYHAALGKGRVVRISIGEAPDPQAAREALLELLAGSMAAQLPRARERGLNLPDPAFVNPGEPLTWTAFARDNLCIEIASIGDKTVAVNDFIERINSDLSRFPEQTRAVKGLKITELALGAEKVAQRSKVPLTFEYQADPSAELTARLRTTLGPIQRRDHKLFVTALRTGTHDLQLAVVSSQGSVVTKSARIEARTV
jgi:hypothetical protein